MSDVNPDSFSLFRLIIVRRVIVMMMRPTIGIWDHHSLVVSSPSQNIFMGTVLLTAEAHTCENIIK
jgi:hypothetical protein